MFDNQFVLDESFEEFLREFGQPTTQRMPTAEEVTRYQGILPDRLLEYWQFVGYSGYLRLNWRANGNRLLMLKG